MEGRIELPLIELRMTTRRTCQLKRISHEDLSLFSLETLVVGDTDLEAEAQISGLGNHQ